MKRVTYGVMATCFLTFIIWVVVYPLIKTGQVCWWNRNSLSLLCQCTEVRGILWSVWQQANTKEMIAKETRFMYFGNSHPACEMPWPVFSKPSQLWSSSCLCRRQKFLWHFSHFTGTSWKVKNDENNQRHKKHVKIYIQ